MLSPSTTTAFRPTPAILARKSYFGSPLVTEAPKPASTARGVEQDPLARFGTISRYGKNSTICFEGDDVRYCFKVQSGTIRLCKTTEDGRRQIAAFLTAGDLFGWVDKEAYNFSAEAVTDVIVERFDRRRMDDAANTDPSLGSRILAVVSRQLESAQNHLVLLGRMTAPERVATFLLDLVKRQRAESSGGSIELAMNRRDLADYLGLTVETVSRVMNSLKRNRVIAFSAPENVRLTQGAALKRLAMID